MLVIYTRCFSFVGKTLRVNSFFRIPFFTLKKVELKKTDNSVLVKTSFALRRSYLYGCGWALHLTRQALYAICLSGWIRFLLRSRMSGGVREVI